MSKATQQQPDKFVRLEYGLQKLVKIAATYEGKTVRSYLNEVLRPIVSRDIATQQQQAQREVTK